MIKSNLTKIWPLTYSNYIMSMILTLSIFPRNPSKNYFLFVVGDPSPHTPMREVRKRGSKHNFDRFLLLLECKETKKSVET